MTDIAKEYPEIAELIGQFSIYSDTFTLRIHQFLEKAILQENPIEARKELKEWFMKEIEVAVAKASANTLPSDVRKMLWDKLREADMRIGQILMLLQDP